MTGRGRPPGVRNVARDPLGPTPPIEDPEDDHVRLRAQILEAMRDGAPRLLCALCGTPVYFAFSPDKRVFFRHQREDGRGTAVTRQGLTQDELREMIYRGGGHTKVL